MAKKILSNFTDAINYKIVWDIYQSTSFVEHMQVAINNQACHGLVFSLGQQNWPPNDVKRQVLAAKPFNLPWSVYWAFGPYSSPTEQVNKLMQSLDALTASLSGEKPSCLYADSELRRSDWLPNQLSTQYEICADLTKTRMPFPVVFGNYSGTWFLDEYMPMAYDWLEDDLYWNANYPPIQPSSWTQFHTQLQAHPTPIHSKIKSVMWQFAGDAVYPMMPHQMDYNRVDSIDWFNYMFLHGPKPVVPPVLPPVLVLDVYQIAVENLTVRSMPYPTAPIMDYLHAPQKITVTEYGATPYTSWGKYAPGRWCNVSSKYAVKI